MADDDITWYVQFPGIQGSAKPSIVQGYIGVSSFFIGISANVSLGTIGSQAPAKPLFTPIQLTLSDTGSGNGDMFQRLVQANWFATAKIVGTKQINKQPQVYVTFSLQNVYIGNVGFSSTSTGDLDMNNVSLMFGYISMDYKSDVSGALETTATVSYNLTTNTAS
jgi:type VI protein secretion system component Hcp